jgi:hypothetical protein
MPKIPEIFFSTFYFKPNLSPNLADELSETREIQDSRRSQGCDLGEERSAVDRVLQPAIGQYVQILQQLT